MYRGGVEKVDIYIIQQRDLFSDKENQYGFSLTSDMIEQEWYVQ